MRAGRRATLGDKETLAKRNIVSQSAADQARATAENKASMVAVAEAQLEIAQRNLGDAEVMAPFDGVVGERIANQGESLPIDGKILALLDTSHVEIAAQMPAADVVRLQGRPARDGDAWKASATASSRAASPASARRRRPGSRSIPVYVEIIDRHDALRGGLFAMGTVVVAEKGHALAVPAAAMRKDDQGDYRAGRRERRAGAQAGRRRAHLVARRAGRGEGPGIGHDRSSRPPCPASRPARRSRSSRRVSQIRRIARIPSAQDLVAKD